MIRSDRAVPRLASDVLRSAIAISVAGVFAVLYIFNGPADVPGFLAGFTIAYYLGWCVMVVAMIVMTMLAFRSADPPTLQRWLVATGPPRSIFARFWWSTAGGGAIWWAIMGAVISLYSLIGIAVQSRTPSTTTVMLGIAVIVASYAMIVFAYAVQYARIDAEAGGFAFPGELRPRFTDYLYLAAQVSTTFASSDVTLTTSRARRAVTLQSLLAMAFNTVLVSLFVSALLRAAAPTG